MALAQSAAPESALLDEIVVTATARATSVQEIPYNISAMSGDALELLNAVSQNDVLRAMYGVTVIDRGYRNAGTVNSIVIRGINVDNGSNGDIMLNAVPTVATYYDNTPLFANFLIKDIDRVEVLRGPQGTLYGSGCWRARFDTWRIGPTHPNLQQILKWTTARLRVPKATTSPSTAW